MILPAAQAQSTTITNLVAPTHSPQQISSYQGVIVTFTVAYTGLVKGESLASAIITSNSSNAVPGFGMSSPNSCGAASGNASCIVTPQSASGVESLTFDIYLSSAAEYDLQAVAGLVDTAEHLIGSTVTSQNFKITVDNNVLLKISVPSSVSCSVDGVNLSPGAATISLQPGSHQIALPQTVVIANGTRLRFDHWMDGSTQPTRVQDVENDLTYTASYVTQYDLTLVDPSGTKNGGWYDEGAEAQISVPSQVAAAGIWGLLGGTLSFQGFYENGTLLTSSTSTSMIMNSPHTVTLQWTANYTTPTLVSVIVFVVAIASVFLGFRRMKPRPTTAR